LERSRTIEGMAVVTRFAKQVIYVVSNEAQRASVMKLFEIFFKRSLVFGPGKAETSFSGVSGGDFRHSLVSLLAGGFTLLQDVVQREHKTQTTAVGL
jgi:hypothetical protein